MERKRVLEVNHLTVTFSHEGEETTAVSEISFYLKEGETLALVGESGSGKSVTALSILGLIPKPAGQIVSGEILFEPEKPGRADLRHLSEKEMRRYRGKEIAMIFQEPMTSLNPVMRCGKQVAEVIRYHEKVTRKEAKQRVLTLFGEVQLPKPRAIYRAYPHQLSGGQKQRVMIAMAMACNPKILIADEPTTALDVTVQKSILELMKELQFRHNTGILFITHDLSLVAGFADRVAVMYRGKIVEEGTTAKLFGYPSHPYTKGLLSCRPQKEVRLKKLPTVDEFLFRREDPGMNASGNIVSEEERETRLKRIYSLPAILEVNDLDTWFSTKFSLFGRARRFVKAVDGVSFSVWPGETLGIVGESGSGKTTLGRTILRLVEARSGSVLFEGKDLASLPREAMRTLRKDLQIIFQDPYSSLNPRFTAGEAISEPMKVHNIEPDRAKRKEKVIELLHKVGLEESHYHRYPHEFSGGQRQRICIARALSLSPKLIICDESVSALDVSIQAQVLNLLNELKREFGFTYLFISHDLSVVHFMSDRLIVMKNGRIEEYGDADAIYRDPRSDYTKKLLEAAV
jgi:peptide/nickel transport system ATP-binding protein